MREKLLRTDDEWREILSSEQFRVLRRAGTEPASSGVFTDHFEDGIYSCAGCDAELFSSETKFPSGCGWPSFSAPINEDAVVEHEDFSFGMLRTEVTCAVCDGHLGHVFPDGPEPTGLRYCINSAALKFTASE